MFRMIVVYGIVIFAMVFRPELTAGAIFWIVTIPSGLLAFLLDMAEYSMAEKKTK